ncbi:MAG: hypothetical protein GY854_14100 [Deltaproteobacteria bacterium]|nr:hypothetical protein [Deltaproteobacteria bacterium]
MSVKWISHKGKKIIHADCKGLSEQDIIANLTEVTEIILASGETDVLTWIDLEGVYGTPEFMKAAMKIGKKTIHLVKKGAFNIDVSITKRLLFQTYNAFTGGKRKICEPGEDPLDWLVE